MEFYDVTFFDHNNETEVHFDTVAASGTLVRINKAPYSHEHPSITIYFESEVGLVKFKNSVLQAFDSYMKSKEAKNVR